MKLNERMFVTKNAGRLGRRCFFSHVPFLRFPSDCSYQYLERGVSNGSHTIPSLSLPPVDGAHRILHIHKNVPGVLGAINTLLSKNKINIVGQYLKTNDEIGYVVLDVDSKLSKQAMTLLKEVKETIRVRMLY